MHGPPPRRRQDAGAAHGGNAGDERVDRIAPRLVRTAPTGPGDASAVHFAARVRVFVTLGTTVRRLRELAARRAGGAIRLPPSGPPEIGAATPFNVQPDGRNAIWAACEAASLAGVLRLGRQPLETTVYPGGEPATAVVPGELTERPGVPTLAVHHPASDAWSNELALRVG